MQAQVGSLSRSIRCNKHLIRLNETAEATYQHIWNNTEPTSFCFSLGNSNTCK
jgi:hypothetical protein